MTDKTWKADLDAAKDAHVQELLELVRMPSVSTDPERVGDVRATAEWVAGRMRTAAVPEVRIVDSAGHPAVVGRWHAHDDQPTILIYGHYDVQPAEPLELWNTPPFEPSMDGDIVYGRGVSDMKGNLLTAVQGVEAAAK